MISNEKKNAQVNKVSLREIKRKNLNQSVCVCTNAARFSCLLRAVYYNKTHPCN